MKTRTLVLVAILGFMFASTSYATDPAVREHFSLLFEDGRRLAVEINDYEGALRQFERAMAYAPSGPDLLWNIAGCHLLRGDRDLALAFFERYMEKMPGCQNSDEMIILMNRLQSQDPIIADETDRNDLFQAISETPCVMAQDREDEGEAGPDTGPLPEWHRPGWQDRESALGAIGTEFYRTASRLTAAENYLDALVNFERSFAFSPLRNTVWSIGSCHLNLGHRDLSNAFFQRYVDDIDGLAEDPQVQAAIQEIGQQVPDIPDVGVRARLWRMIDQAVSRFLDTVEEVQERISR